MCNVCLVECIISLAAAFCITRRCERDDCACKRSIAGIWGEFSSGNYGSKCKNVSESKATGMWNRFYIRVKDHKKISVNADEQKEASPGLILGFSSGGAVMVAFSLVEIKDKVTLGEPGTNLGEIINLGVQHIELGKLK